MWHQYLPAPACSAIAAALLALSPANAAILIVCGEIQLRQNKSTRKDQIFLTLQSIVDDLISPTECRKHLAPQIESFACSCDGQIRRGFLKARKSKDKDAVLLKYQY
jgi:hypothetical protein